MINIGIIGYGNLGKCLEQEILKNKNLNLIGIFSRRKIKNKTNIYPYYKAKDFSNQIDIMVMCGGSEKDLPKQTPQTAKYFNVIDTFDTHEKTFSHYQKVDKICKKYKKNAIISCGWDPGLFSVLRSLYDGIFQHFECFWGKGVSLGHSNAIKRINGVKNAKQYTIPVKKAIKLAKQGKPISFAKHKRLCYVSTTENKKIITNKIKKIPFYFNGQPTKVKFISQEKLERKHSDLPHGGQIFAFCKQKDNQISSNFNIKTSNNAFLTSKILILYINALKYMIDNNINSALTPLQIPVSWLFNNNIEDVIKKYC